MKIILRRNDNTSIYCPPVRQRHAVKTKRIEATIACTLLVVGVFIMVIAY